MIYAGRKSQACVTYHDLNNVRCGVFSHHNAPALFQAHEASIDQNRSMVGNCKATEKKR